jgi:hypothetical protein
LRRGPGYIAVSSSKFIRKLRREAKTNPKKIGVLGLLFVVALWFWVPLVWGWMKDADSADGARVAGPPTDAGPGSAAAPLAEPDGKGGEQGVSRHPWHQVVRWMDNDPQTSATNPVWEGRDPFAVPQIEEPEDVSEEQEEELEQPLDEMTPESLGLVLSGTIVGPGRRVAQINGRTYHQGETIRIVDAGREIQFALAAVHPRFAVLEREGTQFELSIPVPDGSGLIEMSRDGD